MCVPGQRRLSRCTWMLLLLTVQAGAQTELPWPLDLDRALSSTFGETRPAAFHAGIDLKTQGKTGFAIHAPAAGYILRVRTSPWGYGRSLYEKLADGRILVYGHLQGFAPPIAARVAKAQHAKQAYTVDLEFQPGELPIAQGQLIAWSGDSGIGPPHLHLEVRDADNIPLNPLLQGFRVADTRPPVIERLALVPMGLESLVGGGHQPVGVPLKDGVDGYQSADTLLVSGRFGVSAQLYDQADAAANQLAPYRLRLEVDGRPQVSSTYARVSYTDGHQVFLDRSRLSFPGGSGVFFNLFRLPGNRLEFYDLPPGADGLLSCGLAAGQLRHGLHTLVLVAEDVAGNNSRARLQVLVDELPRITAFQLRPAGKTLRVQAQIDDPDSEVLELELARSADGQVWQPEEITQAVPGPCAWQVPLRPGLWRLRARDEAGGEAFATCNLDPAAVGASLSLQHQAFADFAEVQLTSDRPLDTPPLLAFADDQRRDTLALRQTGLQEYRVGLPFNPSGGPLTIQLASRAAPSLTLLQQEVVPAQETQVLWEEGDARLRFPANSAYAPFFPQARRFTPPPATGLESTGVGYAFSPEGLSFDQQVEVGLRYGSEVAQPEKLALYQQLGEGEWSFAGNQLDPNTRLVSGKVRRLLRFALFSDTQPPVISALQPAAGATVEERQPLLRARVDDIGSGIGREEDLTLRLDGKKLIAEYDPEAGTLSAQPEAPLKPGRHQWEVEVRDQSGNQAAARASFRIR
ncbi:MAG: M23 family metallopeptidase [Candidatus Latescibacteria bacterium]|nr:M23 family metallopeptidase [Candidatus Latescibacterota bacterium]